MEENDIVKLNIPIIMHKLDYDDALKWAESRGLSLETFLVTRVLTGNTD